MTTDATRTNAQAMPELNRRRLLLGLAAASTAALGTMEVEAVTASPVENPELLQLAAELPAVVVAYHTAATAQFENEARWLQLYPLAPDELTTQGTDDPWTTKQPGEAERGAMGGWLRRKGEAFPRRIVVTRFSTRGDIWAAKRNGSIAAKTGKRRDGKTAPEWQAEVARLEYLQQVATKYERDSECVRVKAQRHHKPFWEKTGLCRDAFEAHVAAMMNAADWTMEGLIIKAEALAEWGKLKGMSRLAIQHGQAWHGQIASSILSHAKRGAA